MSTPIRTDPPAIRPLPFRRALPLFLLSALPFWIGIYLIVPWMSASGISAPIYLSVGILLPLALLLVAAVVSGDRAGAGLRQRLERWRLARLDLRLAGWGLGLFALSAAAYFLLGGTSDWLIAAGVAPPPEFDRVANGREFWGMPLAGNGWLLLLHAGILLLNVGAEEIWFRGELLPRQELAHGRHAWLIHGLSYHLFHMFYPWDVLRILPESLAYGWVAQRTRSTWPCLIGHLLFNSLGLIGTAAGIIASG